MSVIKIPMLYAGSKGQKMFYSLFDSGANLSCIHPDFAGAIETPTYLGRTRQISTAAECHFIEVKEAVRLDFYLNDVLLSDEINTSVFSAKVRRAVITSVLPSSNILLSLSAVFLIN